MQGYYAERLAAEALEHCYELAPARVQQYLHAEVDFVVRQLHPTDQVLDLGCGYGRTLPSLAQAARYVVRIDTSLTSLRTATGRLRAARNCAVACMDAIRLGFADESFDCVACIQNGISAFHLDRKELIREACRVLRVGGAAFFSTYAEGFWQHRLDWFERQAAAGLIGEIDRTQTRNGRIVCTDGFTSETVRPDEFSALAGGLQLEVETFEVDASARFYMVRRNSGGM